MLCFALFVKQNLSKIRKKKASTEAFLGLFVNRFNTRLRSKDSLRLKGNPAISHRCFRRFHHLLLP